jgi:hypothetical protein
MCHFFVPSSADHARPLRFPYEGLTSCPFTPPFSYLNNVEPNTLPDLSNSTKVPTPNPVLDSTYPTDLLERELEPKFDAQDQPLGTSSSFLSSTHLHELLQIWVRLTG